MSRKHAGAVREMTGKSEWSYYPWQMPSGPLVDSPVPLRCEDLLGIEKSSVNEATAQGMVYYADMSYLCCRILMISSRAVHPAALYMAGQTIEKYLKAIIIDRRRRPPDQDGVLRRWGRDSHDLTKLARRAGTPFNLDQEFLKLCELLTQFNIAGRYPDNELANWTFGLNLVAFLDAFVARCREELHMPSHTPNLIAALLMQNCGGNPVMEAAIRALRDQNWHLNELVDPRAFRQVRG